MVVWMQMHGLGDGHRMLMTPSAYSFGPVVWIGKGSYSLLVA